MCRGRLEMEHERESLDKAIELGFAGLQILVSR